MERSRWSELVFFWFVFLFHTPQPPSSPSSARSAFLGKARCGTSPSSQLGHTNRDMCHCVVCHVCHAGRHTELFNKFLALAEGKLEEFLEAKGVPVTDFYRRCREVCVCSRSPCTFRTLHVHCSSARAGCCLPDA